MVVGLGRAYSNLFAFYLSTRRQEGLKDVLVLVSAYSRFRV